MTKTVKHKAPWTLSQILSWIVPLLLIALLWVLWLTDKFSLLGATVVSVILLIMSMFFLIANSRLKNNSALTAVLGQDEKYTLTVFQAKPRPYWNGKLDEKRNKGSLTAIRRVNFGDTEGIPYTLLSYEDEEGYSRALVLPSRILIQDEVRKYVAEGLSNVTNLKFRNDEEKERFRIILAEGRDPELY